MSGGDSSGAQVAAQAAVGFVRDLYAIGKGYNALYRLVTEMVDGMKVGELEYNGVGMGLLADVF